MATTAEKENKALTQKAKKPAERDNGIPEDASLIRDDGGRTIIRHQVVAKIAGLAVREVEGVHKLVPFGASQQVSSLASAVTRSEMRDLGIHVDVGQKEAAVDVRIITEYGVSIPRVSDAIRVNVAERVGAMTGLEVVEVNIDVVDLYFGEDDEEVELNESRVR